MNYCVEEEDHIIVSSSAVVTKRRTRFLSLFTVFENQPQKVLGFKMEFFRNSTGFLQFYLKSLNRFSDFSPFMDNPMVPFLLPYDKSMYP